MKVVVYFTIFAGCVITSSASAAPATQAEKWIEIKDKFNSICELVHSTGLQVMDIAKRDKPSVGTSIERQLDAAAGKALPILNRSRRAIEDMNLTWEQANQVLTVLKKLLFQIFDDKKLSRLSTAAENQIWDMFNPALSLLLEKEEDFKVSLLALEILAAE